jgi:endonuclease YncB( thermonuclease family)
MSGSEGINPYRSPHRARRRWISAALPWLFVIAVTAGTMRPVRHWVHGLLPRSGEQHPTDSQAARDAETIWRQAGHPDLHHTVDVIRTIDGDTFLARVHLSPGLDLTTRVRLRGIDAPELKAACPEELQMAEAATDALRVLLGEGEVTISNIGPDKYNGRVDADVATRMTPNVSAAMLAAGHARSYNGGHRFGWCTKSGQSIPK